MINIQYLIGKSKRFCIKKKKPKYFAIRRYFIESLVCWTAKIDHTHCFHCATRLRLII